MRTLRNEREAQKRKVTVVARDIDDWMFHFERQVGPRLKELYELNLDGLPPAISSRLQKLRAEEHPQADECNAKDAAPDKR
ncbi:hypothetical protein [Hyphomicrobium sp.]|uniref:hypothetical protein n=1 Tax=Hyphomicrobium sp. TaxID=82 RepID=UPI001DFCAEB4|nr:hypothetical protein [Hyphomicrobium sp.]MBY0559529.1 hypothetical protein [Hyphomicrobium sp.]